MADEVAATNPFPLATISSSGPTPQAYTYTPSTSSF